MYNMIFGQSADAGELLSALGYGRGDFYRYRDCYLENDEIAVYTRGGGGNRECWNDDCTDGKHTDDCTIAIQEGVRQHPLYLRDEDDSFDCTYSTFYFRSPETLNLADFKSEMKRDELWQVFLAALKVEK
jgi:hypothetical protein